MFDFNVSLLGKMGVTVIAENKEEAERILQDTIDSITVKDIREKVSRNTEVNIKNSNVVTNISERTQERSER